MTLLGKNATKTVVAVFIKNGKLLTEQRAKDRPVYPRFLMCPSGHVKENELLEQAMKREMKKELGIEVKQQNFLFSIDDVDPFSKKLFRHNFMQIKSFEGTINESHEAKSLYWKTYKELEDQECALIVRKLVKKLHKSGLF